MNEPRSKEKFVASFIESTQEEKSSLPGKAQRKADVKMMVRADTVPPSIVNRVFVHFCESTYSGATSLVERAFLTVKDQNVLVSFVKNQNCMRKLEECILLSMKNRNSPLYAKLLAKLPFSKENMKIESFKMFVSSFLGGNPPETEWTTRLRKWNKGLKNKDAQSKDPQTKSLDNKDVDNKEKKESPIKKRVSWMPEEKLVETKMYVRDEESDEEFYTPLLNLNDRERKGDATWHIPISPTFNLASSVNFEKSTRIVVPKSGTDNKILFNPTVLGKERREKIEKPTKTEEKNVSQIEPVRAVDGKRKMNLLDFSDKKTEFVGHFSKLDYKPTRKFKDDGVFLVKSPSYTLSELSKTLGRTTVETRQNKTEPEVIPRSEPVLVKRVARNTGWPKPESYSFGKKNKDLDAKSNIIDAIARTYREERDYDVPYIPLGYSIPQVQPFATENYSNTQNAVKTIFSSVLEANSLNESRFLDD